MKVYIIMWATLLAACFCMLGYTIYEQYHILSNAELREMAAESSCLKYYIDRHMTVMSIPPLRGMDISVRRNLCDYAATLEIQKNYDK